MATPLLMRNGRMTVNGKNIAYRVSVNDDDIDLYAIDFYTTYENEPRGFIGSLSMSAEDYESLDEIWLEESVYCAAANGLLPDVAEYCGIQSAYAEAE